MPNVVVVGAQWGDEGKGKVVDFLAGYADSVVRYAGGANAGHTLMVENEKLVVHLLPSGIIHPEKKCLLGAGMVIDPVGLLEEIEACQKLGIPINKSRLFISEIAHVILPYHKELDGLKDKGSRSIGTTKRGIGPCYEQKMARTGIRMWELTDPSKLQHALLRTLPHVNALLQVFGGWKTNFDSLMKEIAPVGEILAPYICDTSRVVNDFIDSGHNVLFEGAQGALLDIDYGTYPYVTSSNTIAGGACTGAGVGPTKIDAVVGVTKAYLTRVGNGPFPTELEDDMGKLLRERGAEYGATTGRPRRCGWVDIPALKKAARVNGLTSLAITKLDILSGIDKIRICTGYTMDGKYLDTIPPSPIHMAKLLPVYEELPGFEEDISGIKNVAHLPQNARAYLSRIESLVGVPIDIVSVGPGGYETIIINNPFKE